MLSVAGKIFDKSRIPQPLGKQRRMRMYASHQIKSQLPKKSNPKFSPFSTVSRTARDSYLLRVTIQPNTKTNYQPIHNLTLPLNRRATIDKSDFTRIIGDVKNPYKYQKPLSSEAPKRCIRSHSAYQTIDNSEIPKPLTTRDCQNFRKTFQNYDFQKMPLSLTQKQYRKKVQSTSQSFFNQKTLRDTIQSNFNNYKRFQFKISPNKAHDFNSDSPHKYLDKQMAHKSPQYNTLQSKQQFVRKSMSKPHGQPRFYLYRQKIATKKDRADPNWNTKLQYEPKMKHVLSDKNQRTIDFNETLNREQNTVFSKYPIRLSLEQIITKQKDQMKY